VWRPFLERAKNVEGISFENGWTFKDFKIVNSAFKKIFSLAKTMLSGITKLPRFNSTWSDSALKWNKIIAQALCERKVKALQKGLNALSVALGAHSCPQYTHLYNFRGPHLSLMAGCGQSDQWLRLEEVLAKQLLPFRKKCYSVSKIATRRMYY
jgi:hypothetical protein